MQKWEYAYIYWDFEAENSHVMYLHPDRPITETFEKKGGFFKRRDYWEYWRQLGIWVTKLGQEDYEMAGVATTKVENSIYWFKRPSPYEGQ